MKKQTQPSPENYIKTRARSLPLEACYINEKWKDLGLASIIIVRKHTTGNLTIGIYLVDIFALGTKDTFFRFNVEPLQLEEILEHASSEKMIQVDYVLVHNIIFGANAFAEDNGYKVCKEFTLTQNILEEDTDEIELMDIEFGKDGQPFLIL